MARLIVKSPYIKCGGGNSAGGYMRYIATRERVELIQNDRPPTRKQEQLIAKLVKDFPDAKEMGEYGDYQEHPTKANASAFISQALERCSEIGWLHEVHRNTAKGRTAGLPWSLR